MDRIIIIQAEDVEKLCLLWRAFGQIFTDYIDALIVALKPFAEAIDMASSPPDLSTKDLEKFFKEVEELNIRSIGTSPKKYGMSLHKYPSKTSVHYNYIPRVTRNMLYQRRAY